MLLNLQYISNDFRPQISHSSSISLKMTKNNILAATLFNPFMTEAVII